MFIDRNPTDYNLKTQLREAYGGFHFNELPTPSFIIKTSTIDNNATRMLTNIPPGVRFRAHVKTHKTLELTLKSLGYNLPNYDGAKHSAVLCSTIKDAVEVSKLDEVTDLCYSLPACVPEVLDQLSEIAVLKKVRLFVDHVDHVRALKESENSWSVFVKIDMGTQRAGIANVEYLKQLLLELKQCENVTLYGFYAHAGHSYGVCDLEGGRDLLQDEISAVNDAAREARNLGFTSELVLSVGATPTAHAMRDTHFTMPLVDGAVLELHCGNFICCDLQQASTHCGCSEKDISGFVLGTVVSNYPDRKEVLTNTGVLALTKETSRYKGYGKVIGHDWYVDRLSQEHGILKSDSDQELLPIGTKIGILPQHACIVMACFSSYFVVDDEGYVVDVYVPWRGW